MKQLEVIFLRKKLLDLKKNIIFFKILSVQVLFSIKLISSFLVFGLFSLEFSNAFFGKEIPRI